MTETEQPHELEHVPVRCLDGPLAGDLLQLPRCRGCGEMPVGFLAERATRSGMIAAGFGGSSDEPTPLINYRIDGNDDTGWYAYVIAESEAVIL